VVFHAAAAAAAAAAADDDDNNNNNNNNNNSVTVKFGVIPMANIVFYTCFDVCMMVHLQTS
jgi:hypothetical protein